MECIICYTTSDTLRRACNTCNLDICSTCWYDKCRMMCPICQRHELNKPRTCGYCHSSHHIKDVSVCCVCCLWICCTCQFSKHIHPCKILENDRVNHDRFGGAVEIIDMFAFRDAQSLTNCPLGQVKIGEKDVLISKQGRNIIVALSMPAWDSKLARKLKMKRMFFDENGNGIACKYYYGLHKKCHRVLGGFLDKLRATEQP